MILIFWSNELSNYFPALAKRAIVSVFLVLLTVYLLWEWILIILYQVIGYFMFSSSVLILSENEPAYDANLAVRLGAKSRGLWF